MGHKALRNGSGAKPGPKALRSFQRLFVFMVALLALSEPGALHSQTVELPLLPDSSMDVDAVFGSLEIAVPLYRDAEGSIQQGQEVSGSFLGESFSAEHDDVLDDAPFFLTLHSPNLSDGAAQALVVVLNDVICLSHDRRWPGPLIWNKTVDEFQGARRGQISCSLDRRPEVVLP